MGIILIFIAGAGMGLGLLVSGGLIAVSVLAVYPIGKHRRNARVVMPVVSLVTGAVFVLLVQFYPYGPVNPGSDYGVLAKNWFIAACGYAMAPGWGVLAGTLSMLACPREQPSYKIDDVGLS